MRIKIARFCADLLFLLLQGSKKRENHVCCIVELYRPQRKIQKIACAYAIKGM